MQGIALASDTNYKVLGAAYPWIARRLLTDTTPELRRWDRVGQTAEQVHRPAERSWLVAERRCYSGQGCQDLPHSSTSLLNCCHPTPCILLPPYLQHTHGTALQGWCLQLPADGVAD